MPKVTTEQRQTMEAHGVWRRFYTRRKAVQLTDDISNGRAHLLALNEFYHLNPEHRERLEAAEKWDEFCGAHLKRFKDGWAPNDALDDVVDEFITFGSLPPLPEPEKPATTETFNGKVASETECIRWVSEVLELDGVTMAEAPSATAWGLYQWALKNKTEFWKSHYTKIMPNKAELNAQGKMSDDGRNIEHLLDRVEGGLAENPVLPPSPEEYSEQLPVPA